jgi:hypothetical protein
MIDEENVNGLEDKLAGTLRPIAPRTEFVQGLGSRIRGLRQSMRLAGASTWQFILLLLAGLLSLGFLLAFISRALFNLFGVRKQESEQA